MVLYALKFTMAPWFHLQNSSVLLFFYHNITLNEITFLKFVYMVAKTQFVSTMYIYSFDECCQPYLLWEFLLVQIVIQKTFITEFLFLNVSVLDDILFIFLLLFHTKLMHLFNGGNNWQLYPISHICVFELTIELLW